MVQLHIDDGCGWMDERRVVELSGAMVASTAGLARSVRQYLHWRWIGGAAAASVSAPDRCVTQSRYVARMGHPTLDVRI